MAFAELRLDLLNLNLCLCPLLLELCRLSGIGKIVIFAKLARAVLECQSASAALEVLIVANILPQASNVGVTECTESSLRSTWNQYKKIKNEGNTKRQEYGNDATMKAKFDKVR